jgi:hypothetical protein
MAQSSSGVEIGDAGSGLLIVGAYHGVGAKWVVGAGLWKDGFNVGRGVGGGVGIELSFVG